MHIDTLSLTGKVANIHYKHLTKKKKLIRELGLSDDLRFIANDEDYEVDRFFHDYFDHVFSCTLEPTTTRKNGYERAFNIMHPKYEIPLGFVAVGGDFMRDSYQIYINGLGCSALSDRMKKLHTTAEFFKMKITRCDIAQDFFLGEYTVDDSIQDYYRGMFKASRKGNAPKSKHIDDMGSGEGSTLYVGTLKSGRETVVYEKGKQLKSSKYPNWVRVELRLSKHDRELPLDLLTEFTSYYVNELPVLGKITQDLNLETHATSSLRAKQEKALGDISHLIEYASLGYGKLLNVLRAIGASPESILNKIVVDGAPSRMKDTELGKACTGYSEQPLTAKLQIWMNQGDLVPI